MPLRQHHPQPPHAMKNDNPSRNLVIGLMASSIITGIMMISMFTASLPVGIVLPTSAPIWMGFSTMFFMTLKDSRV